MQNIARNNDNSANLRFLSISPDPYSTSFSFLERNSATVRNILMVLGRIIKQINVEYRMEE